MEHVPVLEEAKKEVNAVIPQSPEEVREELIRLQDQIVSGSDTPLVHRQIEKLLRTKRVELLGPLAKVIERVEYERGRPVKAVLSPRPKTLFEVLDDPGWDTIRELDVGHCSLQALVGNRSHRRVREIIVGRVGEFLASRWSLRIVHGISPRCFPEVACPNIEEVSATGVTFDALAERFPGLRRLSMHYWYEDLPDWSHPLLDRLDRFSVNDHITIENGVARFDDFRLEGRVAEWLAHYPKLERVEVPDTAIHERLSDEMQACFKALRMRGAEIVLIEGPQTDWWGARDNRYALRWG